MQAAGPVAQDISEIAWLLYTGGAAIFIGVMLLLGWAVRRRALGLRPALWTAMGGVAFPAIVLTALFIYLLPFTANWKPLPPPGALVIAVDARMWWWEVRYPAESAHGAFITANEIHIPTGRPIYIALSSQDVIHSFWVPQLAGKMDMVPGRLQHLLLSASQPGVYRGQCAEFCGEQHALMALHVVAHEPAAFDAWRSAQAAPAAASANVRGAQAFMAHRCDACHTVRGVAGESRLGPDLTHVGSRLFIAAGTMPNSTQTLARWVGHVQEVKTGARMPSYALPADELAAMAQWLGGLK